MTSMRGGAAPGDLVALGVGEGGIEELNKHVDNSKVQWALVEIHIGGETLRRKKAIFLHMLRVQRMVFETGQILHVLLETNFKEIVIV